MRILGFLLFGLLLPALTFGQAAPSADSAAAESAPSPYAIYTADGTPADLAAIVAAMDTVQVVFIGEQHDDPIAHDLQATLLMEAYATARQQDRPVALSLEMFERDVQPILDEYLAGLITEQHFRDDARPWQNYETDYRPLVEFAKAHELPVLAANAPRRYVNRVSRLGPDALAGLPPAARATLPPLPYPPPSPAYREAWMALMTEMMGGPHGGGSEDDSADNAEAPTAASADTLDLPPDHPPIPEDAPPVGPEHGQRMQAGDDLPEGHPPIEEPDPAPSGMPSMENMLAAQALWDAAMAFSIDEYLEVHAEGLVLHMVGAFHVTRGLGTPEALRHYRPGTASLVVVIEAVEDPTAFDSDAHAGLGDFVVLTDASRPRSFDASF
ncbi:MAG: hypothetical protein GVY18_01260 [Bacteroidetes bacterium]|jgi:uncharacterized iron-regulated protein|nr:hypothetical protein [Bacteroidota bacterium]